MRTTVVVVALALGACGNKDESKQTVATPVEQAKVVVPNPPTAKDNSKVERGAYVAKLTGCLVCHTAMVKGGPDFEHLGGGGLEMPDNGAGAWRTPNITPDKSTGIGSWTDDQIARSIREGTRPDGTQLYSIMPCTMYNRMTDDDVNALVAYLRTLKPVENTVAPNKNLKFPQITPPKPANEPDDPKHHGLYLTTLMLCGHCHMEPGHPDHPFSGGLDHTIASLGTGKLYAPNITSDKDTGIGGYSEQQLFTTLKTMVKPNGKMIAPPMLMMQGGWSQVTDADMHAVAQFVHELPAMKHAVPPSTFVFAPK